MNEFAYKGYNVAGEGVSGVTYAKNPSEALSTLVGKEGLVITTLRRRGATDVNIEIKRKPSEYQLSVFAQQMGIMLSKGINIVQTLDAVRQQSDENRMLREASEDIYLAVVQRSLSITQAFTNHRATFGDRFLTMVAVGEESSRLPEVFKLLAKQYKESSELKAAIRGGLVYPGIQLAAAVVVTLIMMLTVVPMMEGLLKGLGAALPPLTQAVLGVTNFLRSYGGYVLIALVLAVFALSRYNKTREGALNLDKLRFKVLATRVLGFRPFKVFEDLTHKAIVAEYAQSMALTYSAGMNFNRCLKLSRESVSSAVYQSALLNIEAMIVDGQKSIHHAFAHYRNLFKPDFIAILEAGVQTGSLDESFSNIGDIYMQQVKQSADSIAKAIEPLLIIVMGTLIGVIVIALFLPFVSVTQRVLQQS